MIPVVVSTYKAPEKIAKCLEHIRAQTTPCNPIVIDNTDDNRLYTKAMNLGIKQAQDLKAEYVLLLTDDAFMHPNCVENLISFLNQSPDFGIASAVQISGEQVSWCGSLQAFPTGRHCIHFPDRPKETPWANGTCLMLRLSMVREIGLLDENMKFICSDSDYSFTARSRGWKCAVVPTALCEHKLDGSGKFGENHFLDTVKINDLIYFTKKWLTGDLFKSLEHEGSKLSGPSIRAALYSFENQKRRLERMSQR